MNLPSAMDVAIGLAFIYLILSLLASEIQELLSTVLQWRAVHVKESIEGLLAGNERNSTIASQARELANQIYANPLICHLNHEAKGRLASLPRAIAHALGSLCRFGRDSMFGKGQLSGPSFIGADAFARSLLDTLQFPTLARQFAKLRLEGFIENRLGLRNEEIAEMVSDFEHGKFTLDETIERLAIETLEVAPETFRRVFGDETGHQLSPQKKALVLRKLNPSPAEVMRLIAIFKNPDVEAKFNSVLAKFQGKGKPTYPQLRQEILALPGLTDAMRRYLLLYAALITNEEIQGAIARIRSLPVLPERLQYSLNHLAESAQANAQDIQEQYDRFLRETEAWFDASMARARGVYKRNARLVAIALGIAIAIAVNADTFQMVDRLISDPTLQVAVNRTAETIVAKATDLTPEEIKRINQATENLALPLGWTDSITKRQEQRSVKWFNAIPIPYHVVRAAGWAISGIAISMGAAFWYDLLGKFIDIKNVGKKPPRPQGSSLDTQSQNNTSV